MPVTKLSLSSDAGIDQYTLINDNKTLAVMVLNYGATITHMLTPDRDGKIRDVVLGFDDYEEYKHPKNPYFGAVIGRYANRIGGGKFTLDNTTYTLDINNGPNSLHGGIEGFDKRVWDVEIVSQSPATIRLSHESPDNDQGYPGALTVQVTYTVQDDNTFDITYQAMTDKETVVNLTNHTYFNLAGVELNPKVLNTHITMTDSVIGFLEVDEDNLPTGTELTWDDAPWMDFTGKNADTAIGARIEHLPHGYDHPYMIHHDSNTDTFSLPLRPVVSAYAPETGIVLTFSTTEPAFQFYTAGWIEPDTFKGKRLQKDAPIGPYSGFCLESSRYPDAPNHPQWRPSVTLAPGEIYAGKTTFTFGIRH